MNNFSQLLDNLLLNSSRNKKINLLYDFFKNSNRKNKGWALSILTNSIKEKSLKVNDIKNLIKKKIAPELFELSYDYVGDLAETISLLWPKKKKKLIDIELSEFMEDIIFIEDKNEIIERIQRIFDYSSTSQIYTIIKIISGGFRVGVSNGLVKESLVMYGKRNLYEIDEVWYGFKYPFFEFFDWLNGSELPKNLKKEGLFNSFMLAKPFEEKIFLQNPKHYLAEYKWDGIRAQIIISPSFKIFSRNSDDITNSFPDLKFLTEHHYTLDGELLIKKEGKILPFNILQKRIRRKKLPTKLLQEFPAHFIAYDILYFKGKKCTDLKILKRKSLLESVISQFGKSNFSLSPLIDFTNWRKLEEIKNNSLNNYVEGLMIKKVDSIYEKGRAGNNWYKWKRDPYTVDFILMYAQRGHGKRSSFYSDFTFGCWLDQNYNKLVPVGKAYSGFTNNELNQLDKWVRNNTIERFGPVRSLKPSLVVEISFDNINNSDRHKSGVALRFPRFSRIRWDKPLNEVCVLKDIKNLIN